MSRTSPLPLRTDIPMSPSLLVRPMKLSRVSTAPVRPVVVSRRNRTFISVSSERNESLVMRKMVF